MIPAPDVVPCCDASANTGGDDCTCWRPVLAMSNPIRLVIPGPAQEGPVCARRIACGDCAYRAGSPERAERGGAIPDLTARQPFFCHDGMPFVAFWEHPTGAIHRPAEEKADYHPRVGERGDPRAWRNDGCPAVLCAGWAAINGIPRADPAVEVAC